MLILKKRCGLSKKDNHIPEERRGQSDIPINNNQDLFKLGHYVQGFVEFVSQAMTPMTVSISGQWGLGKTSFMNLVEQKIKLDERIEYIKIPLWMFSFSSSDDTLPLMLLESIINKLMQDGENGTETKQGKSRLRKLYKELRSWKVSVNASMPIGFSGINIGANIEKMPDDPEDKNISEVIMSFKEELRDEIGKYIDKNDLETLIIFIDDLDRLPPLVAVDILESIKLLFDIEKVIFIVAIDYDVVSSGVKEKYGDSFSDDKAFEYFEKMIQVNFSIPKKIFDTQTFYEKIYGRKPTVKGVETVVNICVEPIPRKMKKLINNHLLICSMVKSMDYYDESLHDEIDDLILLLEALKLKDSDIYDKFTAKWGRVGWPSKEIFGLMEIEDEDTLKEALVEALFSINLNNELSKIFRKILLQSDMLSQVAPSPKRKDNRIYKYNGEMYDAVDYTNKFKEEFVAEYEKSKQAYKTNMMSQEAIIGNESVRDILSNTLKYIVSNGKQFKTIVSNKGNFMIVNPIEDRQQGYDWKNSAKKEAVTLDRTIAEIDVNLSRKDAYVLAKRLLLEAY